MTKKKPTAPTRPALPAQGEKQPPTAPDNKGTLLAQLKALTTDELIRRVGELNASAVSGWLPRTLAVGELYSREDLARLPARQRTARLREVAVQTRVALKTLRQDVRLRDVFFADEAAAAKWLACEPFGGVEREAFVIALAAPETIDFATPMRCSRRWRRRWSWSPVTVAGPPPAPQNLGKSGRGGRKVPPASRRNLLI